jgi:hypothetical protein
MSSESEGPTTGVPDGEGGIDADSAHREFPLPAPDAPAASDTLPDAATAAEAIPGDEPPAGATAQEPLRDPGASAIPPPPPAPTPPPPSFAPPAPPPPPTSGFESPPATGPGPQPGVRYDVPQDQKNLAMISTLGMIIVGFISPLIVFVMTNGDPSKKFANDHAKEGLNFSITIFLASLVTVLLVFLIIGFLLIPLLAGWFLWVVIAGTIQANNGEAPNYPLVPKILR